MFDPVEKKKIRELVAEIIINQPLSKMITQLTKVADEFKGYNKLACSVGNICGEFEVIGRA